MFSGLSAFPLTPMNENGLDEVAFARLIERLSAAGVDAIGALGSTGNYAYLLPTERMRIAQLAVAHAGPVPVMIGIGALRTRDVLALAEQAQHVGASAVLLAPVSYQALSSEEVFTLYETVTRTLSIPLCVYDNPGTTHFTFSDELHGRIAQLPNVRSIKIPGVPLSAEAAKARIDRLRARIPSHVTIGISGDAYAAQSRALYQELFPADTRIVNLKAQFAEHLHAAASNGQGAFFGLLEQAVAALSEAPQLSVQQLDYSGDGGDGGELALQLRADDFASLEQLRQRLLQAGLQVQLGSASREEQGVSARMVIGGGA